MHCVTPRDTNTPSSALASEDEVSQSQTERWSERVAKPLKVLLAALFAGCLVFSSLSLSACGSSAQASEEQDDCYGEDLPVSLDN